MSPWRSGNYPSVTEPLQGENSRGQPKATDTRSENRGAPRDAEPICGVSTGLLRKALHDALGPNIMIYEKPYFEE